MSTELTTRAWVDVSAPALRQNFLRVREVVGEGVGILPMVKADAYGLGLAQAVGALEPLEPWGYGVAAVEEGLRIREQGIRRAVLVLSPVPPGSYQAAVRADLTPAISDLGALERLRRAADALGATGRFHLEIDTGMGRAGFHWRTAPEWGAALPGLLGPSLRWEGCYTHFHSADEADRAPTQAQFRRFQETLAQLPPLPSGAVLHACNSSGALRFPGLAIDVVRPGIFLYGGRVGENAPLPEPVASLRARVTFLREAAPGTTLGYGATYAARGPERWATVGVGYADGLPRALSNRGSALIHGRRVPIIGRISMDVTVLDVTGVPGVQAGDVATFFGRDGEAEITLDEVAGQAGTISNEILTGLSQRPPRIWTDHGGY
jgi:alanine racemase